MKKRQPTCASLGLRRRRNALGPKALRARKRKNARRNVLRIAKRILLTGSRQKKKRVPEGNIHTVETQHALGTIPRTVRQNTRNVLVMVLEGGGQAGVVDPELDPARPVGPHAKHHARQSVHQRQQTNHDARYKKPRSFPAKPQVSVSSDRLAITSIPWNTMKVQQKRPSLGQEKKEGK